MKQLEEKDLMYILGIVNGMAINKEMEKKKNEYKKKSNCRCGNDNHDCCHNHD